MVHVNSRVQKHRDAMRSAGMRLVQIWVPDTRVPGFAETCRRQSLLANEADAGDEWLQRSMEQAWSDMEAELPPYDWTGE